jgi:chromosome segregation ATPase
MAELEEQERAARISKHEAKAAKAVAKEAKLQAKAAKVQAKQAALAAKAAKVNAKLNRLHVKTGRVNEDFELAQSDEKRAGWFRRHLLGQEVVPVRASRRARAHTRRVVPKGAMTPIETPAGVAGDLAVEE